MFEQDFIEVSLPESKELAKLRNLVEHRFLTIQEYDSGEINTETHSYITIDDFERKTLKIISTVREALIYLSLAMHREEEIREAGRADDGIYGSVKSIPLDRNF